MAFESLLSELSTNFTSSASTDIEAEIDLALRHLVEFLGVDRGRVAQMSSDGRVLHTTHTYGERAGITFPVVALEEEFPWLIKQLRAGRVVRLERLPSGLPADATAERAFVERAGIKSLLMLPFAISDSTRGVLSFRVSRRYYRWPRAVVRRLRLVADVIANALARRTERQEIEERLEFERLIVDLVKEFVRVSPEGLGETIQRALQRFIGHFGVERCSLNRLTEDGALVALYAARADAVPPAPALIRLPWYVEQLRRGQYVRISDPERELPVHAYEERALVRDTGFRSHLGVPIMVSGRLWGMIGFGSFSHARGWTDAQAQRLGLVGEIIVAALLRREAEEHGRRQREELTHVAQVAALGELTAALAHELNQPLTAIRTNAQVSLRLLAGAPSTDDLDEVFADIVHDSTRAAELITRLRAFLGRRELYKVSLDVTAMIASVRAVAEAQVRRHGASLALELAPVLPRVLGDSVQLQQVLLNLVDNAAAAMAAGGAERREVLVRTSSDGDHVTVTVSDDGPPVDEITRREMFTPFYTTKTDGLGMGLAISRTIVEAHGGRLSATPRPGGGLLVAYTLPIERQPGG